MRATTRRSPVTFTPTDTTDYTSATATATINVDAGHAGDHLGESGGHHLRHGAGGHSSTRRPASPAPSATRRPPGRSWARATTRSSPSPSRPPTRPITASPPPRPRSTWTRPRRRSPGRPGGHHLRDGALGAQLDATAIVAGTFSYTPAAGTVLSAGNNQELRSPSRPRTRPITPSPPPRRTINVDQATPTITWANPADITYGTARWAHAARRDGVIDRGRGRRQRRRDIHLQPGVGVLVAPADTRHSRSPSRPRTRPITASATATATINVDQATPTITWANPADITYGTALGPPARCDGHRAGDLQLHAGRRDGPGCGQQPGASRHLHAHGHDRLQHRHRHGHDQRG